MWATCDLESGPQAASLCGCFPENALTESGERRSELPSRSTGLTALPKTLVKRSWSFLSASLLGFSVFRKLVAVRPKLFDRLLDLRNRGRDVGQLDDDGLGVLSQPAQEGQIIRDLLRVGEVVGEIGDNAARERDVARFDLDTRAFEEGANDRQERIAGQCRGLVGQSPLNGRGFSFHGFSAERSAAAGSNPWAQTESSRHCDLASGSQPLEKP